jgi:16S rRNA (cytosine967-C5)-methyltransferase
MAEKENIRLLILDTLLEVEKKNIYVKDALDKLLFQKQFLSKQDRAFITRMVEGVTEYQVRLDYVINCFSKT